jgi:hypothetical protein
MAPMRAMTRCWYAVGGGTRRCGLKTWVWLAMVYITACSIRKVLRRKCSLCPNKGRARLIASNPSGREVFGRGVGLHGGT